jgi:hypothetical protein
VRTPLGDDLVPVSGVDDHLLRSERVRQYVILVERADAGLSLDTKSTSVRP